MGTCEVCGNSYGLGVEAAGKMYCRAHCARHRGEQALRDRA